MAILSKAAATVAGFAAGAAIADKVSNIVSETTQAFNKLKLGNVSGSASLSGLQPVTKFKMNAFPNDPSRFAKESTQKLIEQPNKFTVFTYPQDIGKYFIKFSFKEYQRLIALERVKNIPTIVVVFPIPTSLNDNFSVSYQDAKLGPIAGALMEGAARGAAQAGGGVMSQLGGAVSGAAKTGASNVVEGGYAFARQKITNETLAANLDKATGIVPNPHLAAIFQDVGLREHSFSFRFSPKNSNESKLLKNIIRNIKSRMLPGSLGDSSTGPLFTFPDTVDISFGPKEQIPYKFKECVMTSFNVNYSPNGTPSFFKDGNPTDIEISMSFKETKIFTREDFNKDKDEQISSSQTTFSDVL